MRSIPMLYGNGIVALLLCLVLTSSASKPSARSSQSDHHQNKAKVYEDEYNHLHEHTEDKDGLESIRALHQQLDDDNDGTIEPSETGDFIREDLQYRGSQDKHQQQIRQKRFHGQDTEITVKDLWDVWWKSEVHNWTVDQTVEWLVKSVGLPQYEQSFRDHQVIGARLPQVAVGSSFLTKILGVTNPIHRSKITLKAMDVVLFGPPRDPSSTTKDIILTSLLVIAITGLAYAYRQNKRSQEHLKRMMSDMEGLSKAEETLKDLQEKLIQRDEKLESLELSHSNQHDTTDVTSTIEVSRLKEEVEILRNELHRAEIELEDRCWVAPIVLQHWLQLTYELESQSYNSKKKSAEQQLEVAKDMCEKLKRKRLSLVGAFVSTHGGSIDEVDRSIVEAKKSLQEVTHDLTERTQRWRQIEVLCACTIVTNPGVTQLQKIVRHVRAGQTSRQSAMSAASRMSGSLSQDDLGAIEDNFDVLSVAASSSHMTSASSQMSRPHISTPSKVRRLVTTPKVPSSKDSTSSDEVHDLKLIGVEFHSPPPSSAPPTPPSSSPPSLSTSNSAASIKVQHKIEPDDATVPASMSAVEQPKSAEPVNLEPPKILTNSSSTSSLVHLIPKEPVSSMTGSQILREELWNAKQSMPQSEDTASVASDISSVSKKPKKKNFFSFGRKKEKQKEIM